MKKIAVFAGSFDPPTLGHLDVVRRVSGLFDEIILAVASNAKKNPLFNDRERVLMLKQALEEEGFEKKCRVDVCPGLVVDFCRQHNAKFLIRGLRAVSDFDGELQMATMNRTLDSNIETLHVMTDQKYLFLSSTLIKEVFTHGGDLSSLVPKVVCKKLKERLRDSSKNRRK